jgi:drug/metabolite transporter (DMT)-like permease
MSEQINPAGFSRLRELKRSVDRSPTTAVYLILCVQSLMASGTHIVAKVVVRDVEPFTLTLVRSVISAVAMGLILAMRGRMPVIRREDYRPVLWLSFLAIPVNQFLFLYGMRYTIPSNAALLYATTPIVVLVFAHFFQRERLTRPKLIGVGLGFAGVTIVIFERGVSASMEYVYGNLIIFLAVLAWALYTAYGRTLIVKYGAIEASSVTLIVGTMMFIPIGLIPALRFPYEGLTSANWLQICYLGIVTSVFAYLLWYYALGRIEAGKVALFANLQPILTTVLAVVLLGQSVTAAFLVGGTIAIAGVAVAQFG